MKRHTKTLIWFLCLVLLIPLLFLAAEVSIPDIYQDTYYAELPAMYDRLYQTEGKKIVIIGGSNVAFGVDSALLEELLAEQGFQYTVCPFGLYAAVGTSAMLDLSQNALGEGDIVILALEPVTEAMSDYFGATAFWKCAENAPEMLLSLSKEKQNALLGNYIPYLQERMNILTTGIYPEAEGVYAKESFDDRCDLVFQRSGNIMAIGYDGAAMVDFSNVTISDEFAEQVNRYCQTAQRRGAQVCLSFSPVNRMSLTGDGESARTFFQQCADAFHCPIISNPNSYILESGWFYDSNFHLNSAGSVVRTCLLAEDILAWLGCYEPPDYALPQMPDVIASVYAGESNTDDFLFEPVLDSDQNVLGYRVSGLTESGLSQTELTIPAMHQEKPVIGLTDDALQDAATLEMLRLPESVESLPDGAFQNCKSLTQLILEHRDRLCSISEHTFDGAAQIRIYVPAEAYAMYRDGDGCETNLWRLYLERILPYD